MTWRSRWKGTLVLRPHLCRVYRLEDLVKCISPRRTRGYVMSRRPKVGRVPCEDRPLHLGPAARTSDASSFAPLRQLISLHNGRQGWHGEPVMTTGIPHNAGDITTA